MQPSFSIIGFGNPLVDHIYPTSLELLTKYGLQHQALENATEIHAPLFQHVLSDPSTSRRLGGNSLNALRVAQKILQKPMSIGFFGAVGDDSSGQLVKSTLENEEIVPFLEVKSDMRTGQILVLIVDKERSFCCDVGAAKHLSKAYVKENIESLKHSDMIISESYFFINHVDLVLEVAAMAHSAHKVFAFSLSAAYLLQQYKESLGKLLQFCDYLFANEEQAREAGRVFKVENPDLKKMASNLASFPPNKPRVLIITRGSLPTLVVQFSPEKEIIIQEYQVIEVDEILIKDTNGAGDSFAGGFLGEIARGSDISKAVESGHYYASKIIQSVGFSLD